MIVKGIKVNYLVLGEGKPLLILHGWGSNSANWKKVGDFLAEKGLKVIVPDLPGFGKTSPPSEVWNLDDYADFIKEFIKSLDLKDFYLLGHSFGGCLAVKYSLRFPVKKLFLVNAACFRKSSFRKKTLYVLAKMFKLISFPLLRKAFYKYIVRRSDYPYTQGIMKQIYLKAIKEDIFPSLDLVKAPTVVIWGAKDKITPVVHAHLIKSKIKDSKIEIISGVGHEPNLKTPDQLSKAIAKHL